MTRREMAISTMLARKVLPLVYSIHMTQYLAANHGRTTYDRPIYANGQATASAFGELIRFFMSLAIFGPHLLQYQA